MNRRFPCFNLCAWNNRPKGLFKLGYGRYGPDRIIRRNVTLNRLRTAPKRRDGWMVSQGGLRSEHHPETWMWRFERSRYRRSYAGIARDRKAAER